MQSFSAPFFSEQHCKIKFEIWRTQNWSPKIELPWNIVAFFYNHCMGLWKNFQIFCYELHWFINFWCANTILNKHGFENFLSFQKRLDSEVCGSYNVRLFFRQVGTSFSPSSFVLQSFNDVSSSLYTKSVRKVPLNTKCPFCQDFISLLSLLSFSSTLT